MAHLTFRFKLSVEIDANAELVEEARERMAWYGSVWSLRDEIRDIVARSVEQHLHGSFPTSGAITVR